MNNLLKVMQSVVVTREFDLTDLDDAYRDAEGEPLRLSFRVNLSRQQKERRWELVKELGTIQKANKGELSEAEETLLNKRAKVWRRAWLAWWSMVLMTDQDEGLSWWRRLLLWLRREKSGGGKLRCLTPVEVTALSNAQIWEHLIDAIGFRISEYEVELTKKAQGGRLDTSEEQASKPPNSTPKPASPSS